MLEPQDSNADDEAILAQSIRINARELNEPADLDTLLERIGDARYVLLGEASHGTADFYLWRSRLSKRLIAENGFSFVAVEGDWPDCYQLNRYVKNYPEAGDSARAVLDRFDRWPSWMWANWEVAAFAEWLRRHNDDRPAAERIGFYGLDVYSLWESMRAIMDYLERTDAAALDAERNAQVMVDAERYYRAMVRGGPAAWNIRDEHMVDTLEQLMSHHGESAKAIVWEHNTHVGDARATDMADAGMINVGQRVRERHGDEDAVLVGFGSYQGDVIAGSAWGAPVRREPVPEARANSWEAMFHRARGQNCLLLSSALADTAPAWRTRPHRAIGVVYDPDRERVGNYMPSVLPKRYDAFIHIDRSQALHPLHGEPRTEKAPETWPWGL